MTGHATQFSVNHECCCLKNTLQQWVRHMRRTTYESAAASMLHSAADPHQLGLAHEWSGVRNRPKTATLSRQMHILLSVISHSQVETIMQLFAHVRVEPYIIFKVQKNELFLTNAPPLEMVTYLDCLKPKQNAEGECLISVF